MESFSKITKRELIVSEKLKRCCAFSFVYGFFFISEEENGELIVKKTIAENAKAFIEVASAPLKLNGFSYDEKKKEIRLNKGIARFSTIAEYKDNIFKCDNCIGYFLRALFLLCGTVNDPEKSYRLELIFNNENKRNSIFELLEELGFSPKSALRSGKYIIYLRDSESIENFLALIGAVNATFAVMNSKIYKEFINNANRVANCDNANINKSLKANEKYIEAIFYLIDNDKIDILPESLRETAFKRIEFRELNFEQLGQKFDPPISKSGIYNRLEKILEIYKNLKEEI